jgi:hypothetical protein
VLGEAFVNTYTPEDVTTYLHIFVYHFRFFLTTYNSIEKFANYMLEAKHWEVKRILAHGTSGFSFSPAETARQQLCALFHNEQHRSPTPLPPSATQTSWAADILPSHPTMQQFVVSSKFT